MALFSNWFLKSLILFNSILKVSSSESGFRGLFFFQAKKKELARRDDIEDGDSMISSATSDTGSSKRKRYLLLQFLQAMTLLHFSFVKESIKPWFLAFV